jgi:serine/threonine protein kinase
MYFGTSDILSTDKNGDLIYSYTAVFELDSNWSPFYAKVKVVPGSSSVKKRKLRSQAAEVEDLKENTVRPHLKPIPISNVYPLFPETFLQAIETVFDNCHIKPLALSTYREAADLSPNSKSVNGRTSHEDTNPILAKATIYGAFRKSPHPNILQYEGCVVCEGRIVALALSKLYETLAERIKDDGRPINGKKIFSEISAAIHHLHSLGFAHNDLNSWNIMLKGDDTAVLIDFDTCAEEGQPLRKSPGDTWWSIWSPFSDKKKDLHALGRLEQYLNDPLHREQDSTSQSRQKF